MLLCCLFFLVIHFLSIFIPVRKKRSKDKQTTAEAQGNSGKQHTENCSFSLLQWDFFPRCLIRFVRDITMISFSHLLTSSLHHVNANANTISLVHFLCFQFFIGQTNSVNWHCVKRWRTRKKKNRTTATTAMQCVRK